jgi:hypothetical protein
MDQQPEKNDFNLDKILLPQREVRTPTPASRVNAGVLFENEQSATLPKEEAAPIQAPQRPQGPVDDAKVKSLQTFQGDLESVITQKNLSAVSIAAAEMGRAQTSTSALAPTTSDFSFIGKAALIVAGVLLLGGAAVALVFVFLPQAPAVLIQKQDTSPFIAVDNTTVLVLKPDQFNRVTLMQNLTALRQKPGVSLGLMERMYVAVSATAVKEAPPVLTIQELLAKIAPNISGEFLRALDPTYYLLGTHVFDGNQAFLVLKVDSYERAFSGMLTWENNMEQELIPLFDRQVSPTLGGASTTEAAPSFLLTRFRDKIVGNHDARVLEDGAGNIVLLWTFLDRNTLVITTNEWTLKEVVARRYTFTPTQ